MEISLNVDWHNFENLSFKFINNGWKLEPINFDSSVEKLQIKKVCNKIFLFVEKAPTTTYTLKHINTRVREVEMIAIKQQCNCISHCCIVWLCLIHARCQLRRQLNRNIQLLPKTLWIVQRDILLLSCAAVFLGLIPIYLFSSKSNF